MQLFALVWWSHFCETISQEAKSKNDPGTCKDGTCFCQGKMQSFIPFMVFILTRNVCQKRLMLTFFLCRTEITRRVTLRLRFSVSHIHDYQKPRLSVLCSSVSGHESEHLSSFLTTACFVTYCCSFMRSFPSNFQEDHLIHTLSFECNFWVSLTF